jgi:CP family cyanate transporter-like MFS transporter
MNLRGAIAAVSPVLPDIRAELHLSPTAAGLLTTLPVLCFAGLAPVAAWLGRRLTPDRAVLAGLLAIAVGSVLRVLGGTPVLLAGTFLVGAAMTVGNVLLPAVVKREFPARAASVTGMYTGALAGGAALTAALTAPLATLGGWRLGLAAWAVLALVAAGVWMTAAGRGWRPRDGAAQPSGPPARAGATEASGPRVRLWREPMAWAVTAFLGLQSVLYYGFTAWLPTLVVDDLRQDLAAASLAASLFQVLGIPGALLVPALVGRWRSQSGLGVVVAAGWLVPTAGLLLWPGAWLVWIAVGGVVQGAGISLAFTLTVLRARDEELVRRLSGMSQLVGYGVGAAGPVVVGALLAATGGWSAPLLALLGCAVALAGTAVLAGRPLTIGDRTPSV